MILYIITILIISFGLISIVALILALKNRIETFEKKYQQLYDDFYKYIIKENVDLN